jgi:hypothetical protein
LVISYGEGVAGPGAGHCIEVSCRIARLLNGIPGREEESSREVGGGLVCCGARAAREDLGKTARHGRRGLRDGEEGASEGGLYGVGDGGVCGGDY